MRHAASCTGLTEKMSEHEFLFVLKRDFTDLGIAPEDFSLSTNPQAAKLRIAFDTGSLSQRYRNQGIYNYARQLLAQFQTLVSEVTAAGTVR